MPKCVIDIETTGVPFENLDEATQEYLTRYTKSEEEAAAAKELTALWPVTGEVVVIGMLNPDTNRGQVLFRDEGKRTPTWEEDGVVYESFADEKTLLEKFWEDIRAYQQVISFNGRGFDAPFLILRSAIRGVVITKNLMPPRFQSGEHLDLLEQLTFFSATRRFNLDLYCKAFGINTPKDGGMEGKDVAAAFAAGRFVEIAQYNARDIVATAELYRRLTKSLGGR